MFSAACADWADLQPEVAFHRNSFDDPSLWCMKDRQQRSKAVGGAVTSLVIVRYSVCPQYAARGRY